MSILCSETDYTRAGLWVGSYSCRKRQKNQASSLKHLWKGLSIFDLLAQMGNTHSFPAAEV